ncbi:hypothetical protein SSX86_017311 [Deinandra increscens subsp. villosa]|uniref:Potassium transporter n=1 Tax=Deinandra increscens subsp. villosa TaxID=3103831 RepID=A0AAP0CWK6_9ASTR
MDLETGSHQNHQKKQSWRAVLALAYQSLGVVYGDLSTSPLYVFKSTFAEDIQHSETNEEIYGALSFIFWTLTLVPLMKYVFIVLKADDNGEGGTFALYSLLCRHARVSSLPNCQLADEELSSYKKEIPNLPLNSFGSRLKSTLEKHRVLQRFLLVLALVGACMVIGDGVLTPALSVFSAVSGVELAMAKEHHKYVEVPVACIILIALFALQHYGTHRVGHLFAPVVILWLLCISSIGLYNIIHWNPHIYKALSPVHMYKFLKKTQTGGWKSLGGILLCITGSEAMFADLGHFSQLSIQIAFTSFVYPSLILAYMGQAAYLSQHHVIENDYRIGFYISVPKNLRVPVLLIAVLAAVVGSQAIITGTFSIIKQCSSLGCFPRVKIVHTSSKFHGQIYIPEINWILMMLCLAVTIGFRDTKRLGNASGLAVITVMLVTTCLMSLVIVLCWHQSVFLAIGFVVLFGTIEALYFSASLIKFLEGAWVPIALSLIFMLVMYVWHYGTTKKYEFDVQNKVSVDWLLSLAPTLGIVRVRGIGLVHTELVSGIPAIFSHFVTNLPAFHQVLIFLCVKSVPVPHVRHEERFLVGHIGPREHRVYRCIVRYGYRDVHKDDVEFEKDLVCSLAEFIRKQKDDTTPDGVNVDSNNDEVMTVVGTPSTHPEGVQWRADGQDEVQEIHQVKKRVRFVVPDSPKIEDGSRAELRDLMEAREAGVAYIMGHAYVKAKQGSSLVKKVVINLGYELLRRNSRSSTDSVSVSHASTLEVGMVPFSSKSTTSISRFSLGFQLSTLPSLHFTSLLPAMAKIVSVFSLSLLLLTAVSSAAPLTSPASKLVNGVFSNAASSLMKWAWSLKVKTTTKTSVTGRPLMKFESGYNVETVFDGSKLGIEPHALELLPNGELLVLDSANSNLYKISSSLSLYSRPKLVAGSPDGHSGHIDGRLREAKMNHPKGLTVDDKGNVYIADTANMAIRKISETGVTTIAGGGKMGRGGHVDGPSEDAKFSNDFDVLYIGSSCSLLVIDRGNQAIREIQLPFDDCAYQYGSGFPIGIAVLVAAGFFGYMIALLQRRVGSMLFNQQDVPQTTMKPNITPTPPYQKPTRPPLIPSENDPEKQEEGFVASLGKLMADATSSFSEILTNVFPRFKKKQLNYHYQNQPPFHQNHKFGSNSWPVQDSFVIPDGDEPPPSIETRTPKKTYPFMTNDAEKIQQFRQSRHLYSGLGREYQQPQPQPQQHHNRYYSSVAETYYEESREKTNEIVFGAVQEQGESMVIKPLDYGNSVYDHRGRIRSGSRSRSHARGFARAN